MKPLVVCSCFIFLLSATGCLVIDSDAGPTETSRQEVDAGKVEAVRAEIRMGAGELRIEGGAAKLLEASFKYSEKLGKPDVRYDSTGFRGRLTVESSKKVTFSGKTENIWELRLGSKVPLDLNVHLGAGESHLDVSKLPVQSLEVHMGAGKLDLNLAGNYTRDFRAEVHGGVGEARIKLPKNFPAVIDAKGGIGSLNTSGLTKRNGRYYNDAYTEGKPALHLEVRGGIGEIDLAVVD